MTGTLMIDGAEFVADITGCASWVQWDGGVIVVWPDRPPQFFTRNADGKWSGDPVTPTEWPMKAIVDDDGRSVWVNQERD